MLVEVPNSSLGMEQLELHMGSIRAGSGSTHPISPATGRAARDPLHRDGYRLRPGYEPTDSAVSMAWQGRTEKSWRPALLWSWWSRVWWPQGTDMGSWAMRRVQGDCWGPGQALRAFTILFLSHCFPSHLIFKYNVNCYFPSILAFICTIKIRLVQ